MRLRVPGQAQAAVGAGRRNVRSRSLYSETRKPPMWQEMGSPRVCAWSVTGLDSGYGQPHGQNYAGRWVPFRRKRMDQT